MTTTTTTPSATVTLPVSHLQLLRVRTLAHAALRRIALARSEAYWASPAGRERMNAMWCGEQDGICAEHEEIRRGIEEEEELVAQSIADAITSAEYTLIGPSGDTGAGLAMLDIELVRHFANAEHLAKPAFVKDWNAIETRLREFLKA